MKKITIVSVLLSTVILSSCTGTSKSSADAVVPIDKSATEATQALYANMLTINDKGIMFGHQDATLYGIGWKYESNRSDVKSVCGDYPAVYGWEIGDIELGNNMSLDSVPFDTMRQHILAAYKRGGVNTISWHANNPITGGNSWDKDTKIAVKSILPNGEKHEMYKGWLDKVSEFMLSLKDDNGELVPILFRPFHEHTGAWFWWGSEQCTPEEYISLYRFTVDYLKDVKNVHNLLYTYSPDIVSSANEYNERYPGDNYVDILGIDAYHHKGKDFRTDVPRLLERLDSLATQKNKPMVFSETGLEGVPDSLWWTQTLLPAIKEHRPAYVLVWRNAHNIPGHFYGPYPGSTSANDFIRFKNDSLTFFEKDLPPMYKKK